MMRSSASTSRATRHRAVVDAMERDMGTILATKADLQLLRKDMEIAVFKAIIAMRSIVAIGLGMLFATLKLT